MNVRETLCRLAARRPVEISTVAAAAPVVAAVAPEAGQPSTSVLLAFRDGVLYEAADRTGIAHFVEHIVFRGSRRYPSLHAISRAVESIGGHVSAFSTRTMVAFFAKTPPGGEAVSLDVLSDLATGPLLEPASIEAERAIIEQERQRELANPSLSTSLLLESLLLWPDPVARHPVGSDSDVAAIDRAGLESHLAATYHRGNAVAVVAGAVGPDTLARLGESLARLAGGPRPAPAAFALPAAGRDGPVFLVPSSQKTQAHVCLGWRFPVRSFEEKLAWSLVNTLLGAGYTSLLNLELRERRNVTYVCTTKLAFHGSTGVFKVGLSVKAADAVQAIGRVEEVIAGVAREDTPADVFDEAVIRHASSVAGRLEDSLDTARWLGQALLDGRERLSFGEHVAGLFTVDRSLVSSLVREHLAPARRKAVLASGAPSIAAAYPDAVVLTRRESGEIVRP